MSIPSVSCLCNIYNVIIRTVTSVTQFVLYIDFVNEDVTTMSLYWTGAPYLLEPRDLASISVIVFIHDKYLMLGIVMCPDIFLENKDGPFVTSISFVIFSILSKKLTIDLSRKICFAALDLNMHVIYSLCCNFAFDQYLCENFSVELYGSYVNLDVKISTVIFAWQLLSWCNNHIGVLYGEGKHFQSTRSFFFLLLFF